jgi:hypothetical protein
MAHVILAILLASAMAATLVGRRANSDASTADGQLSDRSINTMDLKNRLRDIETDCRNCFHV